MPSPFPWRSVTLAAIACLLVAVVVTRGWLERSDRTAPDGPGQIGAPRDLGQTLTPSPVATERFAALGVPSTSRCVDHHTSIGIAGVRIGDGDPAVVTNAAGVFVRPPSAGWTRFASSEHGNGSVDLSASATDAVEFRLRRVFPVTIRILVEAGTLPGTSLRLDRLDADATGVQQNRTLILEIPRSHELDVPSRPWPQPKAWLHAAPRARQGAMAACLRGPSAYANCCAAQQFARLRPSGHGSLASGLLVRGGDR